MAHQGGPIPLTSVEGLPDELAEALRKRGILSCEQLYVSLCLEPRGGDFALMRILGTERAGALCARLEGILPMETREALRRAAKTKWTEDRPLGVPSERPEVAHDSDPEKSHE